MSAPEGDVDACELPKLWVGAAGFSQEQRAVIEISLPQTRGSANWRLSQFGEADAWLVDGANCHVLPNGNLRISPGVPTEAILNLDVRAADRPVAFATPVADKHLEPHYTFDASSSDSVRQMLAEFEACLRFARAQFVLGSEVVERGASLRHGVFHVSHGDKLLAVLDFWRGEVSLCPQLVPAEVEQATWAKRPQGAQGLPPGFVRSSPAQLAWNYGRRSERSLLPSRYRSQPIYYRRSPRVPLSWLRDSHLKILRELSGKCAGLAELTERTGLTSPQLDRDLACLFYAGAITTTWSKAAPPALAQAYAKRLLLDERAAEHFLERSDPTVPGRVEQLRMA